MHSFYIVKDKVIKIILAFLTLQSPTLSAPPKEKYSCQKLTYDY